MHHILRLAKWDCQDKASIVRFLPNSSLVVEVGAFDGSEAVIIAKEESVRKLVSYEPGSAKVGMIKGKIAAAGLEHKIDFRSKAASNYSGKADFFIPTVGTLRFFLFAASF